MELVDVGRLHLAVERRGQGPPVVLLHGLPGDSRIWAPQLDTLADEFTVVAWDAPGCGRSSDPDEPFGLTEVATALVALVEALDLGHPHLVGLSWGGGVALEATRIAPDLPRSLVLAGGYAGWAGSLPPEAVAQRLDAYLTAAATPTDQALQGWGPGMFSPTASEELIDDTLDLLREFHPGPLAQLARSFAETDLRPVLPTVRVPTLVLQGDADARSPVAVGEALHEAIPGSTLSVLHGVGHISNLEAPEAFDAEVRRFLRTA